MKRITLFLFCVIFSFQLKAQDIFDFIEDLSLNGIGVSVGQTYSTFDYSDSKYLDIEGFRNQRKKGLSGNLRFLFGTYGEEGSSYPFFETNFNYQEFGSLEFYNVKGDTIQRDITFKRVAFEPYFGVWFAKGNSEASDYSYNGLNLQVGGRVSYLLEGKINDESLGEYDAVFEEDYLRWNFGMQAKLSYYFRGLNVGVKYHLLGDYIEYENSLIKNNFNFLHPKIISIEVGYAKKF